MHARLLPTTLALLSLPALGFLAPSDHSDTPALISMARHDARITDFYAFQENGDLVVALCLDPTVPPGVSSYVFPSDLALQISIDVNSRVEFEDAGDLALYGGTVVSPFRIQEDIKLKVTFPGGVAQLETSGIPDAYSDDVQFFAGLRDDPFIRTPREGRNVAAVVIELPMEAVVRDQSTLLLWATAKVPNIRGPFQELGARALRNQFPENVSLNSLHPRFHALLTQEAPDVVIYDVLEDASYPNGRALEDDVVDLVGDPRVLSNDAPFPTANDVPFLTTFPYLAPPQ